MKRALLGGGLFGHQVQVKGTAQFVGGEHIAPVVTDPGRRRRDRINNALNTGTHRLRTALAAHPGGGGGGAGKVKKVSRFGVVELKGAGERFEDTVRGPGKVSPLKADVVIDAHPGEHRDFLAAQPGHAPVAAVDRQSGLLGRDPCAAGGQELPHVVAVCHGIHATPPPRGEGGTDITCNDSDSRVLRNHAPHPAAILAIILASYFMILLDYSVRLRAGGVLERVAADRSGAGRVVGDRGPSGRRARKGVTVCPPTIPSA